MNRFKTLLLSLLLAELLFSYAPAFAQTPSPTYSGVESSITTYLCNPLAGGNGVLYQCINQIYKFAIIVASVMGVFFIVIAGYVYMSAEGNSESTTKAKDILTTTITALVILFAGYALLYTINPDLVQFHGNTLQPVNIAAPSTTGITGATTVLAGYNIGAYDAGEPQQAITVTSIYNKLSTMSLSTANQITQYMNSSAQGIGKNGSPMTGQMVLNASASSSIDPKIIMAIMETESHYGSDGATTAVANFNPGNIQSGGTDINYGNWQSGVNAIANWLNGHKV